MGVSVTAAPLFTLKLAPEIAIDLIVTFEVPESVSTTDSVPDDPAVTFPKLTVLELGERGDAVCWVDVPPPPRPASPQPTVTSSAASTTAVESAGVKLHAAFRARYRYSRIERGWGITTLLWAQIIVECWS